MFILVMLMGNGSELTVYCAAKHLLLGLFAMHIGELGHRHK
jgi:hypothetical protein